jgi:hypothetical protein
MDRTHAELQNRIDSLTAQRDALAEVVCEKTREADLWRDRFKQWVRIARMVERERDAAVRRAEMMENDRDDELERDLDEILDEIDDEEEDFDDLSRPRSCSQCGAYPFHGCRCYDKFPGTRIPDLF